MLDLRGKVHPSNVTTQLLSDEFIKRHEMEWEHSKRKYEFLDEEINLYGSVYYTRGVLSEQLQRIKQGKNKVYALRKK